MVNTSNKPLEARALSPDAKHLLGSEVNIKSNQKVETGEQLAEKERDQTDRAIANRVEAIEQGKAPTVDPNILKQAGIEAQNPNAHLDNLQGLLNALNSGESFDPAGLTDTVLNSGSGRAGLN